MNDVRIHIRKLNIVSIVSDVACFQKISQQNYLKKFLKNMNKICMRVGRLNIHFKPLFT